MYWNLGKMIAFDYSSSPVKMVASNFLCLKYYLPPHPLPRLCVRGSQLSKMKSRNARSAQSA